MSLTINGATNTITAASGLTIAGNTAVTGALSATATSNGAVTAGLTVANNGTGAGTGAKVSFYSGAEKGYTSLNYDAVAGWRLDSNAENEVRQLVNGTVKATLSSTALTLGAGVNLVMASGQGIDFSATSNGSGTTTSEVLSDYEEGTFTATMTCTTSGTITLAAAGGDGCSYTKTGRAVAVQMSLYVDSVSSPLGGLRVNGLPFTSAAGAESNGDTAVAIWVAGIDAAIGTNILQGYMAKNTTSIVIQQFGAGTSTDTVAAFIKANSAIDITFTYFV